MLSIKEMFYSDPEPVWILKEDGKKDGKDNKPEAKVEPPKATPLEMAFGPLYPYYFRPYTAPPDPSKNKDPPPKKNIVELKIPYNCCPDCNSRLMTALQELPGLKKDTLKSEEKKGKVTLELTKGTADDVLLAAREVYCKARLWTKDD